MAEKILPRIDKNFYKKCSPEETIRRIREILYKCGIFVTEISGECGGFYHSHINIANDNLITFGISTNGKGNTPAYALASAYAEMMERLQNGYKFYGEKFATITFLKQKENTLFHNKLQQANAILDYASFSDEKEFSIREYINSENCIFTKEHCDFIIKNGDSEFVNNYHITCVPYYEILSKQTAYLPSKCHYSGSNGMCAGNTCSEALIQGFCEIFERYALKKIMIEHARPPQIPLEYFKGSEIYNKIMNLSDLNVIVLDCSFQLQLPVIGAIIINKQNNTCCLEMAGASTAAVALERCLTEHFQDDNPDEEMSGIFSNTDLSSRENRIKQFYKQSRGFGQIDLQSFFGDAPDYDFNGFHTVIGNSFDEELIFIIQNIIVKNKFKCYIRDNSILGFPTYHIYIPQMSNIYDLSNEDDLFVELQTYYFQPYVLALKLQNEKIIKSICENSVEYNSRLRSCELPIFSRFLYNTQTRENIPDEELFLSTLYLHIKEYKLAYDHLCDFVQRINTSNDQKMILYFNCFKQILYQLSQNKSDRDCNSILFSQEIINEVLTDLSSEDKLQYYKLPTCFYCERCPVAGSCCFFDAMKVVKQMQKNTVLHSQDSFIDFIEHI